MPPTRLTPEQRKARIRAALARADEKPGAVEKQVEERPVEPVVETKESTAENSHPVVQEQKVAEPTTSAPAKPAPITEQTIARGVQRRHSGGMKEPNYQLHVLMALTVAFLVQGLATGWGTVKTAFNKTTGG